MRTHGLKLGKAASVLVLLLAGCSDARPDPGVEGTPTASHPTTPPTSASPTPATPEELASAALQRYFEVTERAEKSGRISDLSGLSEVASGDAFFEERKRVRDFRANGVRLRGTVRHDLGDTVGPANGVIVIADCEDRSGSKLIVISSGDEVPFTDPQGNQMPDTVRIDYSMSERAQGEWVVEAVDVKWRGRC